MAKKKAEAAEPVRWEARAAELTPRGTPYQYFGHEFPPDQWVEISGQEAEALQRRHTIKVRHSG